MSEQADLSAGRSRTMARRLRAATNENATLKAEIAALKADAARKDEALRFYADEWTRPETDYPFINPTNALSEDQGAKARAALAEGA